MSWQRMSVKIKGEDPIEIQTTARDWAAVVIDPAAPKALDMTFRVAHAALRRMGNTSVPNDYDGFLDVLEAIPDTLDDEAPDLLDPTQRDR
jgi:hypothetical protein